MNILREFRRVNKRSMPLRIILLLGFCVIFIVTTYAWFSTQKNVKFQGLEADTTAWDISYYINSDENEILDKTAVFTIEQLYPGMPEREDLVHIYNMGKASTEIQYEVISLKVFGKEVLSQLDIATETITETDEDGVETVTYKTPIFSGDTVYPFEINYTYDKTKLIGQYEEGGEYEDSAQAAFKFHVNWTYEGNGTATENLAKDVLDTQFGKNAYAYYQDEANDPSKAIEIKVRITSTMIHPDDDQDYPYDSN